MRITTVLGCLLFVFMFFMILNVRLTTNIKIKELEAKINVCDLSNNVRLNTTLDILKINNEKLQEITDRLDNRAKKVKANRRERFSFFNKRGRGVDACLENSEKK